MNRFRETLSRVTPVEVALYISGIAVFLALAWATSLNRRLEAAQKQADDAYELAWDARALTERHLIYDHKKELSEVDEYSRKESLP